LLADAVPSTLGRKFLVAARERLRAWGTEQLPGDIVRAAEQVNLDHRLCWRLRHLRVPDAVVGELAEAWIQGRPRPAVPSGYPTLRPAAGAPVQARLLLTRTRLVEPGRYDVYRAEPELAEAEVAGSSAADLALVNGDAETAAVLYERQIRTALDAPSAWAGLALATRLPALVTRPELVHALHREVRARSRSAVSPDRLARWLDRD
jgi:hypothetical protein